MNENPNKKRLSEQLPSHSANPGSWQRLSAKLDAMDADAAYYKNLEQLPTHTPDEGSWNIIYNRLNRIAFAKAATRLSLTAAAGLLLFFTVSRISDNRQQSTAGAGMAMQEQPAHLPAVTNSSEPQKPGALQVANVPTPGKNTTLRYPVIPILAHTTALPEPTSAARLKRIENSNNGTAILTVLPSKSANIPESFSQNPVIPGITFPFNPGQTNNPQTGSTALVAGNSTLAPSPVLSFPASTPKELIPVGKTSHFALAMEYAPENIANGTGTSLFHNVDLAASYTKNKLRVNTSMGMAYNQDQLTFDMNYDIQSAITGFGPGGKLDTIGYQLDKMESQYQGTEKHQYLTYNIGIGGKLFSLGKFSSWVNVGTGFGFSINNPDLISATANSIKAQYNAVNASVRSSEPVYNNVYMNLTTGIDFNYKILSRLSVSLTPLSRWYFKPVLTQNNEATDDITFGFSTGIKYDF
jgi:hypothetical protein